MFDKFSHYLIYGSTDQETMRELTDNFNGLIVPGTVAAFQKEGTGSFVMSLSATVNAPPYVIDPRFPLFQQALPNPKQSHLALANLLDAPNLISKTSPPSAALFTDEFIEKIANKWLEFNINYQSTNTKFDKYAKRLKEEVKLPNIQETEYVIPLYTIAINPEWASISSKLFKATTTNRPKIRVIATESIENLSELLEEPNLDEKLAIWISGLDELKTKYLDLADYAHAIKIATSRGKNLFSLYGGFFSVLMAGFGLVGSAHGIGFGEYRRWQELSSSGPPPPRYYLPQAHRYISQELAQEIWLRNKDLMACSCKECENSAPLSLNYQSLMKHSVYCRAAEIEEFTTLDPIDSSEIIKRSYRTFQKFIESDLPPYIASSLSRNVEHLNIWSNAIDLALAR